MAEGALLAHVEEGELLAVAQHGLDLARRDDGARDVGIGREVLVRTTRALLEIDALRQRLEAAAIKMQMQRLLGGRDGVEIVRHELDRVSLLDGDLAHMAELALTFDRAVVDALVDDVMLGAANGGDDGPGGVVVRRRRLARGTRRGIDRIFAVRVLGQVVDLARSVGAERELLGGEELAAARKRHELWRDARERLAAEPHARDRGARALDGLDDRLGPLILQRHGPRLPVQACGLAHFCMMAIIPHPHPRGGLRRCCRSPRGNARSPGRDRR